MINVIRNIELYIFASVYVQMIHHFHIFRNIGHIFWYYKPMVESRARYGKCVSFSSFITAIYIFFGERKYRKSVKKPSVRNQ